MYITAPMAKMLKESVLADTLPISILSAIDNTPYCTALFMGENGMAKKFLDKALSTRFDSARNTLKNFGQIDSVDANTVEEAFQKILVKCQAIEEQNKNALEKLAVNYVIDLFSVPDDMIKIEAKLVNKIEGGEPISPVEPFDGDMNFEADDIEDISGIDAEVAKKNFLNLLNMGAGMSISENVRGYLDDLYDIDSRLPQLYKEALALNDYMIFKSPELGITDKSRNQIGFVSVNFAKNDELVTISAQGEIFPVLLCELIRGFMELFSSHGLPKERKKMEYIIKKSDYLKAEPWQMRIGPYMWEIFTGYFEDTDTSEMPYIYKTISSLKPITFFKVFSEMMAKTKKGKKYAKKIEHKALYDKDLTNFSNKMSTRKTDKSIITDEYMLSEEF